MYRGYEKCWDDCQVLAPGKKLSLSCSHYRVFLWIEKEKELFISQCQVEVHTKTTCAKSQGHCEPYVFHIPSSTRSGSWQVQWPRSKVKTTLAEHSVFWMDLHLWTGHKGHGRDTLDLISSQRCAPLCRASIHAATCLGLQRSRSCSHKFQSWT